MGVCRVYRHYRTTINQQPNPVLHIDVIVVHDTVYRVSRTGPSKAWSRVLARDTRTVVGKAPLLLVVQHTELFYLAPSGLYNNLQDLKAK